MKTFMRRLCVLFALAFFAAAGSAEPASIAGTGELPGDECTAYTFTFADQYGDPVAGVIVSVCGELFCAPAVSGRDGVAVFEGEPAVYEVHILALPDGYSFDMEQSFTTEAAYGNLDFMVTRN